MIGFGREGVSSKSESVKTPPLLNARFDRGKGADDGAVGVVVESTEAILAQPDDFETPATEGDAFDDPNPPPPTFAQPPAFFGLSSTFLISGPIGTLVMGAGTPAAPMILAISFASRFLSFSRRLSDSPVALSRARSAALVATARARW